MRQNFHESFQREDVPPPPERSTGIVFAVVSVVVGAIFYDTPAVWGVCAVLATGFALVSWLKPAILKPLNILWFRFSLLLHRIVNPVIMLVMYVVAILPFGLVMQLLRDPLQAKRGTESTSYWARRGADGTAQSSMENQF